MMQVEQALDKQRVNIKYMLVIWMIISTSSDCKPRDYCILIPWHKAQNIVGIQSSYFK